MMSDSKGNANGEKEDEHNFKIGESLVRNHCSKSKYDYRVNGFKLLKKIDEGGFGQVFKVTKDDKTFYAMKLELSSQEGGSAIKLEIDVLQQLPKNTVFPEFISGGRKPRFQFLVLELLGDNLKMLKSRSPNPEVWTDGTWSRIGIQCLYAIKVMHDHGFVHRDIKPNNFAIGMNTISELRSRRVLLFDFGLARKFVKSPLRTDGNVTKKVEDSKKKVKTNQVKPSGEKPSRVKKTKSKHCHNNRARVEQLNVQRNMNRRLRAPRGLVDVSVEEKDEDDYVYRVPRPHTDFRGTHQYASPNAHLQKELGRHDDLWSLMYMIAEFFVELPWTNNDDIPVDALKDQASLHRLFVDEKNPGRLTQEMRRQLNEIDKMLKLMNYYTHPNYEIIYQFLKDTMNKAKVTWDTPFDWEIGGQTEVDKTVRQLKKINFHWENPGSFFKNSRWVSLKMPSLSPPVSSKQVSTVKAKSVMGYKKSDYKAIGRGQMSKEDTADDDNLANNKAPTPAQKSPRKEPDVVTVESKK